MLYMNVLRDKHDNVSDEKRNTESFRNRKETCSIMALTIFCGHRWKKDTLLILNLYINKMFTQPKILL
jgi:hypothetical protein